MKIKKIIVAILVLTILCVAIPASAASGGYLTYDRMISNDIYTGSFYGDAIKTGIENTIYLQNFMLDGVAIDANEITFEWYKGDFNQQNNQIINGETTSALTFTATVSESYTCFMYLGEKPIGSCGFSIMCDTISITPVTSHKAESDSDLQDSFYYVSDCVQGTNVTVGVDAESSIDNANITYEWRLFDKWTGEVSEILSTEKSITVTKTKGDEYYDCMVYDGNFRKSVTFMLMPNNTLDEKITINGIVPKRFERGHMAVAKVGDSVTMKVESSSTNGEVSYRWEKVEFLFDEEKGYYNKITNLGSNQSITVTKQDDKHDIYGFEQFECYIDDGNEVINIGFVLFLLDPYQVTTETSVAENTPEVSLDNSVEDLANSILQDEMEALQFDKTAKIKLTAENQKQLSKEEQTVVDGAISKQDTVGACLDINLYKEVEQNTVQVTETAKEINLSIKIPTELISNDTKTERTYKVIRVHDGKAESLDCNFDADSGTVLFSTDKFSTYVLTYSDKAEAENVNGGATNTNTNGDVDKQNTQVIDTSKTSPDTSDNLNYIGCAFACAIIVAVMGMKKAFIF